jgi:hypothetical protein
MCNEYRAVALGCGSLTADLALVHKFPLPPSLSGIRCWRRLAITLAWFTPINPLHQHWRRADLWFSPTFDKLKTRRKEADWQAVQRGTIQHEIMEGKKAAAYIDGDAVEISVNCKADAGILEEAVPYALAVSLEVPEELGVDIYNEVTVLIEAARVTVTAE